MSAKKILLKNLIIGLLIIISPVLTAQQVVTGRITDAANGMPVQGASVFVANTTIGTASDASGNYSFTVPGRGSFEIVVSHVGYRSVFHKIEIPQDAHQYSITLETHDLEGITVSASKTYRQSDVNLFWLMILGERPSKNGMEVLEPEKVYFYRSGNILKALCREPVEIINHHTGYRIQYVLQSFEHDYRNRATTFYGMPHFEELIPANSKQQDRWEKKRQEVFAVSVNRFLRALYRKEILEEGFVLINPVKVEKIVASSDHSSQDDEILISPVSLKDILQIERDVALLNVEESLLLFCCSKPVTMRMIKDNYDSWVKGMSIPVARLLPSQITVYSNGTYQGLLVIDVINKYMNGLSSMVPVEYPESTELLLQ